MLSAGNPIYAFSVYNSIKMPLPHHSVSLALALALAFALSLSVTAIYRPHTYLLGSLTNLVQPKYGLRKIEWISLKAW